MSAVGYEQASMTIEGISPLLMHNGRLSNPLDPMTKKLKSVSNKGKKTDQDFELLSKLEFVGGLYTTEPIIVEVNGYEVSARCDGRLCIPSDNLEACFIEAAKRLRLGKQARAGVLIEDDLVLVGSPKVETAFNEVTKYYFIKRVRVKQAAVMRTRAIFHKWSGKLAISYLPGLFNNDQIYEVFKIAGQLVGIGDFRPKYGRFHVV